MAVTMPDPESTVPQGNTYLYFTTIKKNLKETKKENGLNKQTKKRLVYSLLGNQHGNNRFMQETSLAAQSIGQNNDDKQGVYTV